MNVLKKIVEQIINIFGKIVKYRFYTFIAAYIFSSYLYKINTNIKHKATQAKYQAEFVDFRHKNNTFIVTVKGQQIQMRLNNAILPKFTQERDSCENKLASRTHTFLHEKVFTKENIKVLIEKAQNGVYYGDVIVDNDILSKKLINISLAYPKNAPKNIHGDIDWCVLLQQYQYTY
ncbi:MAG: hypothetical protein JJW01_01575 [Alphaproteobacteria bacterium]|nr:hypothetical protein [Rickettsiales bacterium]